MFHGTDATTLIDNEETERDILAKEAEDHLDYPRLADNIEYNATDKIKLRESIQLPGISPLTETMEAPKVAMETPAKNRCGVMLESVKRTWSTFSRDSKRAIVCLMLLVGVLSIVVIVTVSKSAKIQEVQSDSIWNNIRLPETVVPSRYDVKLKIDMTNERFEGSEDVHVTVVNQTTVILIHMSGVINETLGPEMNITQYSVHHLSNGVVGKELKVKHAFPFTKNNFYVMKMKQTIEPGEYVLKFKWESRLVRGLDGIYISNYNEGGVEKKLLASQMEPLAARKVMPCFDEPNFKAKFSMEIQAEEEYGLVLWNMPQKGDITNGDTEGWKKYLFDESVIMSTYLLAFVVADFKCTDAATTNDGVKVRTCGRKDPIENGAGEYSTLKTKEIIEEYEKFYGTKFPLKKIDSVAAPDFSAGAMENWGLIIYRETALLYNPEKDTYSNKARVNVVVAHELAHQWFGNLVTMKWWNDLWLNEGFASYVEWIGTNASEPKWNYYDFQTYSDRARAFGIDSYTSSRPTSIAVEKPADITAQFDAISYSKGSAILVQAKMFMDTGNQDTENFENAIRKYINDFEFKNTVQNDLYLKLHEVYKSVNPNSGVDIVEVMNTWTLQMNFPVVMVHRYDENHVIISQKRFLISGPDTSSDKPSPYGYQWFVPIEYSIKDGQTVFEWLKPHSTIVVEFDFTDDTNFIHLNKRCAGYYIVDYSYDLTQRLRKYMKVEENYKKMTVGERQGLLYDTFLQIGAGSKPISEGIALMDTMKDKELQEDSLVPLREISRQLSSVYGHISDDEDLAEKWKAKYTPFAKKLFDEYGARYFKADAASEETLPTDDVNYGFQKRQLASFAVSIGCTYGVDDCIAASVDKFNKYKTNGVELGPDFKSTILNTAMSRNTTTVGDWDFLWEKYQSSTSATEKSVIQYALGLINDEAVLLKYSGYCLDPKKVRRSDALYILGRSLTQTKLGRDTSWKFMQQKWNALGSWFSDSLFAVDAYISGVLSGFTEEGTLADIEEFFSTRMDSLGSGRAAYESAIQSIKGNIEWLKKNKASVEKEVA